MTTRCDTQRADSHFSIPAHNRPSRNGLDVNTFGAGSSSLPASDYSSRLTPTGLIHLDKYRSPDVRHVGDMDERTTGPDPDHQSRHLRVDTAIPTNDHVDQTPHVVRLKIPNRGPNQTSDGDQGRVHRLADQHPTASEAPPPVVPGLRRQQVRHGHLHDSKWSQR